MPGKKKSVKKTQVKKSLKKAGAKKAATSKKRSAQPSSGQSGPALDLHKSDLNNKESRLVTVLAGDANPVPINALATNCFSEQSAAKANSWVRNSLRRLVRAKWVERVGDGTYRLTSLGHDRFDGNADTAEAATTQPA